MVPRPQVLSRWLTSTWQPPNRKRWNKTTPIVSLLNWLDPRQTQWLVKSPKVCQLWDNHKCSNQWECKCPNNKTQPIMLMLNNINNNRLVLNQTWASACNNNNSRKWWEECQVCRTLCTGNNSQWVCPWCSNLWWEVCNSSQWWAWLLNNPWWAACLEWCRWWAVCKWCHLLLPRQQPPALLPVLWWCRCIE